MAKSDTFTCSECQETFNKSERRKHRRKCSALASDVYYLDLSKKVETRRQVTAYRDEDGTFSCLRCYKAFDIVDSFSRHTRQCKNNVNISVQEDASSPLIPLLPTPQGSSLMLSSIVPTPEIVPVFSSSATPSPPHIPSPLPPFHVPRMGSGFPGSSSSQSSTSSQRPLSMSAEFTVAHCVPPAPLVPPVVPYPKAVHEVALPLLRAFSALASSCPICWIRGLRSDHELYGCPNAKPKKLATSQDALFRFFKGQVHCPVGSCFGCFISTDFTFDAGDGQDMRFHGDDVGRKGCAFIDSLLPIMYYVYYQPPLRRMLNVYGVPGLDFTSCSEAEFARWLVTKPLQGYLPPPLVILHTMIEAFGMPQGTASRTH